MRRTIVMALSGILAFAGFARAQYQSWNNRPWNSSDSRPQAVAETPGQPRSLRTGPLPPVIPAPAANRLDFGDRFHPVAFIQNVYLDVIGREPSDEEASYWLRRMPFESRRDIYLEILSRRPAYGVGHYDPAWRHSIDPGGPSYPDPARLDFPDPGGPYFNSPYFPNYERSRPIRAFPLGSRG